MTKKKTARLGSHARSHFTTVSLESVHVEPLKHHARSPMFFLQLAVHYSTQAEQVNGIGSLIYTLGPTPSSPPTRYQSQNSDLP